MPQQDELQDQRLRLHRRRIHNRNHLMRSDRNLQAQAYGRYLRLQSLQDPNLPSRKDTDLWFDLLIYIVGYTDFIGLKSFN